jgi:hypothetical protein
MINPSLSVIKDLSLNFEKSNIKNGVTGVLLFSSGIVMQYIEGDPSKIDSLFSNIKNDNRHYNIIKLLDEEIHSKIFKNWGMKFKKVELPQLKDLEHQMDIDKRNILIILQSFIKVNEL